MENKFSFLADDALRNNSLLAKKATKMTQAANLLLFRKYLFLTLGVYAQPISYILMFNVAVGTSSLWLESFTRLQITIKKKSWLLDVTTFAVTIEFMFLL